jgi:hypothetical protein
LSSCSLFLKIKGVLFKIVMQGVSLWHFSYIYIYIYMKIYKHIYLFMHCNLNWFIPSIFMLSTLVPFYGDFNRFKNPIFILV